MKGIILSGGTATRLFPLTSTTSKQLLPVYDYQMIFYPLNTLISAGIKEILLIVTPEHSGQYLNLLGDIFKKYRVNIQFNVQKVPRGLPEAFIIGESFIGKDNVTMILGDNIFEDCFSEQIKNFTKGAYIFTKRVTDPERFGVLVSDEDGTPIEIIEKPTQFISEYAITGLYVYDNTVIKMAKMLKPSMRKETEIVDLHKFYLAKRELVAWNIKGEWLDAGTFDSLLDAGNIVREKGISKNMHPIIQNAVKDFNEELKKIAKSKL